jgi:hypothetical protein
MADLRITELAALASADLTATDPLAVADLSASETKKITAKDFTQKAVTLIDDASIPNAKVNLSGISGTNLTDGTVTAAKLNTSTIPATGGLAVSSGNLGLVAPTSPIVRNGSTGSLEHATSGVTAGTYTKLTVDAKGHVTAGTSVAAADLPIAVSGTVGVMSPGTGLSVTGGGVLNHSSSITAGTTSGFTYNAQGHITGAVALAGADLPVATSSVIGGTRPGTGLTVDGSGILSLSAATNSVLGGVIAGSDFAVSTGTISLATQGGLSAGQYTKITVNSKGIATAGSTLVAGDIPSLPTSQITSGTFDAARFGTNTIAGSKFANYATAKIADSTPTADYISQLFFNPLDRTLFMWDGNVYQPIGVSYGQVVFSGTYDASTNLITSVTVEGTAIGLVVGAALPSAVAANKSNYVVVDQPGTGTAPAPIVALSPPDILLSTGSNWVLLDVSDTVTAQLASNVQVVPAGNIASSNVQSALQELDSEKLALTGGTITGNLEIGTAGSLSFEGSTANAFETTLAVVDPTADRTITLPNVTGTVVTTGDTGTVTSTMLLNDTIVDADINSSAEIAVSKLADGAARQLLQTDAAGTGVEWTNNVDVPGTLDVTSTATFDATAVFAAGSAGSPSLTIAGDTDTGIYSPGANQVAISTNGTGRLFVTSDGTIKTSSNISLAGASAGGVRYLSLLDEVSTYTGSFVLQAGGGSSGFGGAITMYGHSHASYPGSVYIGTSAGSSGALIFGTNNALDPAAEKMRITAAGLLGLGTSSPQSLFHLSVSGLADLRFTDTGEATDQKNWAFQTGTGIGAGTFRLRAINDANSSGENAYLITKSGTSIQTHQWLTGGTERARIDSSGRLLVGTSSDSGGALLQVNGDRVRIATAKTPASASDTGVAGEICWDASYVYVCTATNTWKRTAISTW